MIAIFFFCFFYFIDNKNQTHALVTSTKFLFSIIYFFLFVIFFIFFFYIDLYTLDQDSFLLFISLYKLQNMFIVNDLIILFLIFFNFYVILFYAIGLILLLTTLYLFQAFWSFIIFNVFVIGKKKHKTNWAKTFKKRPNKNFKKIIKFFKKTSK